MNLVYLPYYLNHRVEDFIFADSLNGIESDIKYLVIVNNFLNYEDLISQNANIHINSGIGIYYTQPIATYTFKYTVYNSRWYSFYILNYSHEPINNALILNLGGYITGIITQSEDRQEDYYFRTLFIDTLLKGENLITKLSTFKTDVNFEEDLSRLDIRSYIRKYDEDYLNILYNTVEEKSNKIYVKSIVIERRNYYNIILPKNEYLSLSFTPVQDRSFANMFQKIFKKP